MLGVSGRLFRRLEDCLQNQLALKDHLQWVYVPTNRLDEGAILLRDDPSDKLFSKFRPPSYGMAMASELDYH